MATQQLDSWFADAFGVDPVKYLSGLSAPPPATPTRPGPPPSAEPAQEAQEHEVVVASAAKAGVVASTKVDFELAEFHTPNHMFKIVPKAAGEVSFTVETIAPEAHGTTKVAPKVSNKDIGVEIGHAWMNAEGLKIMGVDSWFVEGELAGGAKFDREKHTFEVTASITGKMACGLALAAEVLLVRIGEDWSVKAGTLAASITSPRYAFKPKHKLFAGVQVDDIGVQVAFQVEIEPDWTHIAIEVGKRFGKEAATDGVVGEVAKDALAGVNVDIAIASGFLLIAAVTIAASVSAIGVMNDAAGTPALVREQVALLLDGYKQGIKGYGIISGPVMQLGFDKGKEQRELAVTKLQAANPGITDDQIQLVLDVTADRLTEQARAELEDLAKEAVWITFFNEHKDGFWSGSQAYRRDIAWQAIFGRKQRGEKLFLEGIKA